MNVTSLSPFTVVPDKYEVTSIQLDQGLWIPTYLNFIDFQGPFTITWQNGKVVNAKFSIRVNT